MSTAPPSDPVAPRAGHRASAKDVARLAGVSTATVSRVVNLAEQVDADTRARVREAMLKLRYVPHTARPARCAATRAA